MYKYEPVHADTVRYRMVRACIGTARLYMLIVALNTLGARVCTQSQVMAAIERYIWRSQNLIES
jgi:hypothetical protein